MGICTALNTALSSPLADMGADDVGVVCMFWQAASVTATRKMMLNWIRCFICDRCKLLVVLARVIHSRNKRINHQYYSIIMILSYRTKEKRADIRHGSL